MKPNRLFRSLPIAAAVATLGLGAAGDANAYAYAYSDLEVKNGTITVLPNDSTALTSFVNCFTTGNCPTFTTAPAVTSSANANLGGTGTSTGNATDAAVALGTGSVFPDATTPTNNSWTLEGSSNAVKYSWADSQVISEQTLGPGAGGVFPPGVNADGSPDFATKINTRQIAEGNTIDNTIGQSGGDTTSSTEFQTNVLVNGKGGVIRFDLDVVIAMLAEITTPDTGKQAIATSSVVITITPKNGTLPIFGWSVGNNPEGSLGAQAFSNGTCSAAATVSTNTPGSQPYSCSSSYFAVTNNLDPGQYVLNLSAIVTEKVEATVEVPEPATLGLLGLGLGMLGFLGRRRRVS